MAHTDFYQDIIKFNAIYNLDSNDKPTLLNQERLENFHNILSEEVDEIHDIIAKFRSLADAKGELAEDQRVEVLTDLSDWLGDIIVYCASEARRWGLPLDRVLGVIMQSNFSKLDAQGQPIKDERGKVMKGPNYWKPEPKIAALLSEIK